MTSVALIQAIASRAAQFRQKIQLPNIVQCTRQEVTDEAETRKALAAFEGSLRTLVWSYGFNWPGGQQAGFRDRALEALDGILRHEAVFPKASGLQFYGTPSKNDATSVRWASSRKGLVQLLRASLNGLLNVSPKVSLRRPRRRFMPLGESHLFSIGCGESAAWGSKWFRFWSGISCGCTSLRP